MPLMGVWSPDKALFPFGRTLVLSGKDWAPFDRMHIYERQTLMLHGLEMRTEAASC